MTLAQKHFQFLRKGGFADVDAAKSALITQMGVSTYAGEPIIAYYGAEGVAQHVLLGIGDSTSGASIFYNAETTDALLTQLHTTISGSTNDQIANGITLNALKNAIEAAKKEDHLSSSSDVLVVTTDSNGTAISIRYDNATVKSSGSGVTFDNGDSVASGTTYVADAIIEDTFKVLGKTVGNLASGTEIKGGTTMVELLKAILVKEEDCTANVPTITISNSPSTTPVEVGSVIDETITVTYNDGSFTADKELYGLTSDYNVAASCAEGNVTYSFKNADVTKTALTTEGTNSYTDSSRTIAEGDNTWYAKAAYGANTVTPKKNTGANSTKSIAAGTTTEKSKTIVGQYKWYIGETTATSIDDIVLTGDNANVTGLSTGWTATANTTTMKSSYTSSGKSIFVLVKGTLTSFKDSLSKKSLLPNFVSADKTVAIGGTSSTTYKGYLYSITSGAKIEAIDVIMTR